MEARIARASFRRVLVTDRRLAGGASSFVEEVVVRARHFEATMVLLREKDLDLDRLIALSQELVSACPVPVVVADRPEAAAASGAAGVQLGWTSPRISVARLELPLSVSIGVSVHSLEEGKARAAEGADSLMFGPIRPTPKPHGPIIPLGFAPLAEACRAVSIPVVAIGGLNFEDEAEAAEMGAAGIAAIRAFWTPAIPLLGDHA